MSTNGRRQGQLEDQLHLIIVPWALASLATLSEFGVKRSWEEESLKHRNLLILGASGGCGRWAVRIAKERGYRVTVLVRQESNLEELEGVRVVQGNVMDSFVPG